MADLYTHAFSDSQRLAKSKTLLLLVTGLYNLVRIPRFTLIHGVHLWIKDAMAGDTIEVGYSGNGEGAGDDNYFLTTAQAAASALGYKSSGLVKYFDAASGAITYTLTADMLTTDEAHLFVEYTVIH